MAEERRGEADAVDVFGRRFFAAGELKQRRKPVFEAADAVGGRAGGDVAFPGDDGRLVDAGLVERAFAAAEAAGGVEEIDAVARELSNTGPLSDVKTKIVLSKRPASRTALINMPHVASMRVTIAANVARGVRLAV